MAANRKEICSMCIRYEQIFNLKYEIVEMISEYDYISIGTNNVANALIELGVVIYRLANRESLHIHGH